MHSRGFGRTGARRRLLPATTLSLVLLAGLVGAQSAAAATPSRMTLSGSTPAWAKAANYVGAAEATTNVGFRVYLGWRDAAGAAAVARAVSNPLSASYGKYLTPAQFRTRFAPSAADVAAVKTWLRSQGFAVGYTPLNNRYVSAEGTTARVQTAFGAKINVYRVKGQLVRSPATALSVPASLKAVQSVVGLDDSSAFVQTYNRADKNAPPAGGFRNAPPLSDYWAQFVSPYAYPAGFTDRTDPATAPWTVRGYTPAQIKGAYGIDGTYTGAGQTVAVIDAYASPTILQDVNTWSTRRGLPTMKAGQLVQVVAPGTFRRPQNPRQDPQGWAGEETLDIEAVHGMAPAAKIVYVGAPNNYQDLDASMNHVVDRHLAQIVTNSYGFTSEFLPKGFIKPFEDTLIQAAAEGIGVYFSSGDNGDNTSALGFAAPDWPATSPWVTAVGGTALAVGAANNRVFETGWGTSTYGCDTATLACTRLGWLYGAGGGTSRLFAKPSYQAALPGTMRMIPDVSALGDPQTGFLVGQTQTFPNGAYYDEYRIGGTSLSSPIFAGIMALADQAAGRAHGFANPLFYANAGAFYDVTSVKTAVARRNFVNGVDATKGTSDFLRTLDDYSGSPTQHTNPGWDNVTGLGSPSSSFLSTFGQ